MNSHRRFAVGLSFVACAVIACSSVERDGADGSAGSAGLGQGGLAAGGSSADAGAGGHAVAGGSSAGGTASAGAGGAGMSAGGGSAGKGGGNAAGTGGRGVIGAGGDNAAGTAGDTSVGAAGMGAAGEAGGPGTPPPPPLLKNGSFEAGGLAGWQALVTPDTVGKAIYAQWGNSAGVSIDGMYEVSFWNGTAAFTGDLHQTVTGLTPGKYELKLYIAYGTGINAAYLYAIGCGPQDVHQDLPLTPGVPSFTAISIPSIDVTNDSCTVGLFADMNTGDWLNADAFVFDALPAQ